MNWEWVLLQEPFKEGKGKRFFVSVTREDTADSRWDVFRGDEGEEWI